MGANRGRSRSQRRRLLAYSTAAGAALALAGQAEATIIHYEAPSPPGYWEGYTGTGSVFGKNLLLFNADGGVWEAAPSAGPYLDPWAFGLGTNRTEVSYGSVTYYYDHFGVGANLPLLVATDGSSSAQMFSSGDLIGGAHTGWNGSADLGHSYKTSMSGPNWTDVGPWFDGGYLGLHFSADPSSYYGWADVRVAHAPTTEYAYAYLYAYAYNTDGSITAGQTSEPTEIIPEPSTLLLLVLGVSGLAALKARRSGKRQNGAA